MIIRELEAEIAALAAGRPHREELKQLMTKKEIVGDLLNHLRLARQRALAPLWAGGNGNGDSSSSSSSKSHNSVLSDGEHLQFVVVSSVRFHHRKPSSDLGRLPHGSFCSYAALLLFKQHCTC